IVNRAAKMLYLSGGQLNIPLVVRGPGGAGHQLGAQHSQALEAWFCHVPGLKVVAPATPADAKGLLKTSIRDNNPVVFIESEVLYGTRGEVPDGEHLIPLGVADVKRPGRDVTIVAHSKMVLVALDAAADLANEGIEAEVVDPRTLRPLDTEAIVNSVKKTNRVVIVEEGWEYCGVGAEFVDVIQRAAFDYLDAPILRVTGVDVPMPYAKNLEHLVLPDKARVKDAVYRVLYRQRAGN
ncbi:MAG: alpha-ketoacid dehydrogenase subunit beta, partial [Terriglobia bacterium]